MADDFIVNEDTELFPGRLVKSTDPKDHTGVLRVIYGPYRDPECLLIDDCGHFHYLNVTKGDYRIYKRTNLKYRVLYGAHHETGPFHVTEDYYWNEEDFKSKHPDKAWGFVKVIEELGKHVEEKIGSEKI